MPTLGEVELQEKNTDKVPLLNTKPSRPKAPEPQNHEHIHEMGCQDKYRPEFFGHAYHWSEILTLIMLLTCAVLGFLNETKLLNGVNAFVLWIICASIAFLGNIFLWNIGWVESDAAYSRKISNFCDDIHEEAELLAGNIDVVKNELEETGALATAAAKQTAAMAKQCGVVDESGNIVMNNLKQLENVLNSPVASGYKNRQRKISIVMNKTNFQSKRDNAYHDLINIFKVTGRNSNSDSTYFKITDKKKLKKLKREVDNYNKECESYESEKISLDNFTESDADGDGKVSLFEFCEHIYHKIIQRELGAEPRKIFDMQNEMEKAKKRMAEIKLVQDGEQLPEEMEDFEINDECVVFAAPPGQKTTQ